MSSFLREINIPLILTENNWTFLAAWLSGNVVANDEEVSGTIPSSDVRFLWWIIILLSVCVLCPHSSVSCLQRINLKPDDHRLGEAFQLYPYP